GPWNAVAIALVGAEVDLAPAQRHPAPDQRFAAHLVGPYPPEGLAVLEVDGVEPVIVVEMGLRGEIGTAPLGHDVIALDLGGRQAAAIGKLPGALAFGDVVLAVLDHAAAVQHQDLHPLFAQFLGGPAAADA